MPKCSTTCQLLEIYQKFCNAVADGKEIRVVFLDISQAFDKVWHAGLVHKLRLTGISGDILEWLKEYLRDRQQRACINGQFSSWAVVGPLLFLVFINDWTNVVRHTQIRLFADDTCLFITVDNRDATTAQVNVDLDAIEKWSDEWLVTFSAPKTKSMIISNKMDRNNHHQVSMHNSVLEDVSHHKHLGLVLSNNLCWTNHIDVVYVKAMKRLYIIQSFKFKLDRNSLDLSFVLPILEYGDIVWSGACDRDLDKLDKVHVRAMRLITGATERSHTNILYEDLGWHKLSTLRLIHRLKWFYKIINNIAPQYLTDIVPPTVGERLRYNLRTHGNISQIRAQQQCYIKSFFPSTTKSWNMLPIDIRNYRSLSVFERRFKLNFPSPSKKPWFSVGELFVNIHHTRIRIGCSKLKAHLHFDLHLEDDPSCRYRFGIEDPYHFLFTCPLYVQIRVVMLDSISHITPDIAPGLSLLLRGDINLTFDQNKAIFEYVKAFIRTSSRF